ncbi:MAG: hypothetical protein Q8Q31_04865 [Nanoarchaeota archaeon]|nr:hypothetical protein [Nanoarchaeota archaeon]
MNIIRKAQQNKVAEVSNLDYLFFLHLSSAYEALRSSATDPVVLRTFEELSAGLAPAISELVPNITRNVKSAFSHIYWDCHDNEEYAERIMKLRIKNNKADLIHHDRFHNSFLESFQRIREKIRENNRENTSLLAQSLCASLLTYGEFIKEHQVCSSPEAFLLYPSCVPGHVFYMKGANELHQKSFNPECSLDGYINSVQTLSATSSAFRQSQGYFSSAELFEGRDDDYAGPLQEQIRTNRLLLSRAGLNL